VPAVVRGLSIEPMIEAIVLGRFVAHLDWVICGGERGGKQPFDPDWARALRDNFAVGGTAFFMKQFGRRPLGLSVTGKGEDPGEWPIGSPCEGVPANEHT